MSERIIRRRLQESGFCYLKPLSKPLLTLRHEQDRLQMAKLVENQDWSKVIAADDTTFRLTTVRRLHWQNTRSSNCSKNNEISIEVQCLELYDCQKFG